MTAIIVIIVMLVLAQLLEQAADCQEETASGSHTRLGRLVNKLRGLFRSKDEVHT